MARDSFIFYRSFYEAIKEVSEEQQLQVYRAISIYALEQEEIELEGVAKAIFSLVKPQLDANYKKYENGKQSKSKTKAKEKQTQSKIETNVNVNVNENDNVNANANVSDSCVDGLQKAIDFYNNNIGMITPYGLEVLSDYAKEMQIDLMILAMKKAVEANKRTIQYIKGILNNWSKKGIKTVIEAEKEDEQFKDSKQIKVKSADKKQFQNYEQRQYSNLNGLYANKKEEN